MGMGCGCGKWKHSTGERPGCAVTPVWHRSGPNWQTQITVDADDSNLGSPGKPQRSQTAQTCHSLIRQDPQRILPNAQHLACSAAGAKAFSIFRAPPAQHIAKLHRRAARRIHQQATQSPRPRTRTQETKPCNSYLHVGRPGHSCAEVAQIVVWASGTSKASCFPSLAQNTNILRALVSKPQPRSLLPRIIAATLKCVSSRTFLLTLQPPT